MGGFMEKMAIMRGRANPANEMEMMIEMMVM
jgi:hypothetical protein